MAGGTVGVRVSVAQNSVPPSTGWPWRRVLLGGTALAAPFACMAMLGVPAAIAACDTSGATVTCSGTTNGFGDGTQTGLTINVNSGATVTGNPPINISDTNTVNNSGTIAPDAAALSGILLQSNDNTVNNNATGVIRTGADVDAVRGVGVTGTRVNNFGFIDGRIALVGAGNFIVNAGFLTISDPFTTPGAVHTANTFTQTAAGTLAVYVDNFASFNGGVVAQTVNLAGALRIVPRAGLYDPVTDYGTLINATGARNGTFSSVVSTSPFLAPTLVTVGNSLNLLLTRISFGSVSGMTPNQRAIGNALEGAYSTGLGGNAATFYGNLLAATSVTALDQLSGESTSAAQGAAFGTGAQFNGAMFNQALGQGSANSLVFNPAPLQYAPAPKPRGHEAFAALKAPPPAAAPTGRWRVWSAGFGGTRTIDGEASAGTATQSTRGYGGVLGVDYQAGPDLMIGFAAGGSETNFSVESLATTGRLTGGHVGAYAMKTWGVTYAAAAISYGHFTNSTTRTIVGIGPMETATGSFASDQIGGRLELGWSQIYGRFVVTPFVAIEPATLRQSGYTEASTMSDGTPGILGLSFASRTTTSLPTFVGAQAETRYAFAGGEILSPYARASWVHEFLPTRQVTATFVTIPGTTFTADGARAARDAARLDTGATLTLRPGRMLFANFAGEWSDRSRSYGGSAGFKLGW